MEPAFLAESMPERSRGGDASNIAQGNVVIEIRVRRMGRGTSQGWTVGCPIVRDSTIARVRIRRVVNPDITKVAFRQCSPVQRVRASLLTPDASSDGRAKTEPMATAPPTSISMKPR